MKVEAVATDAEGDLVPATSAADLLIGKLDDMERRLAAATEDAAAVDAT